MLRTILLLSLVSVSGSARAEFSLLEFQKRVARFTAFASARVPDRFVSVVLDAEWSENLGSCMLTKESFIISLGARVHETSELTANQLDLILCHELGHLLGAPPKKKNELNDAGDWASAEGESDYFAGSCLRALWGGDENESKIALAAEGFFRLLHSAYGKHTGENEPDHRHSDRTEAAKTVLGYPSLQCRLDSVLAGARSFPRPSCWHRS